jgi:pimeloyl-ACP methyl ester carboxylesterase
MNNYSGKDQSMYVRHFPGFSDCPVLLLHGFLETGNIWLSWISKWSHDLFVPDLPGHGESKAWNNEFGFAEWGSFLLKHIEQVSLKSNELHLIGHSMGGYLALEIARLFPDKAGKIVLLHSTPMPDSMEQIVRRQKQILFIQKGKRRLLTKNMSKRMFSINNKSRLRETGKLLNHQAQKCTDEGMINALLTIMNRGNLSDIMLEKEKDILLVTGGQDPFMPETQIQIILSKFPGIHHKHFAQCGHASFIEEPEITRNVVLDFLSR